jgi:nucleotide-binding universal stress UspA family protein
MKRIFLPTDFSDTALKSAHFALDLFGTADVRYTLVNSYQLQVYPEVLLPDIAMLPERESRSGLRQVERLLRKYAEGVHLAKVSTYLALPEALNELAARKGGDLIVMGTQGKSSTLLFGRNASTVVQRAQLPMITVPAQWEPQPVKHVLLPLDSGTFTADTFRPLLDLVQRTGAEVLVAHVRTNAPGFKQGLDHAAVSEALKGINHRFITVHGSDVVDTVNELVAGGRMQLVAMVHRKRGFLDGLFHTSTAKRMALHTNLPLLVLRQS